MYGALLLFDQDFIHVMSITFTSLILTELLMVALTIRTWHWMMVAGEVISLAAYIATLVILKRFFGEWTLVILHKFFNFKRGVIINNSEFGVSSLIFGTVSLGS